MSKATKEAMDALHGVLAEALTNIIKDGVKTTDKDGNVVKAPASAAFFKEAREFLKDNGIESLPTAPGVKSLADALPFPAPGDEADGFRVQ